MKGFLLRVIVLLTPFFPLDARGNAEESYFYQFRTYASLSSPLYNTSMQGMCIDQATNTAFFSKINERDNTSELISLDMGRHRAITLLKNEKGSTQYNFGHANDLAVRPSLKDSGVSYLYIAPGPFKKNKEAEQKYSGKIIRLSVNRRKPSFSNEKKYSFTLDEKNINITGITYASDIDKFILKTGNSFYIGVFDDDSMTFDCQRRFKINRDSAIINGREVDVSSYIGQGISYDNGNLFVPLWDNSRRNVSVVLVYRLNINNLPKILFARDDLSYRIASRVYDDFEIESVDFFNGKLFFSANAINRKQADLFGFFYR